MERRDYDRLIGIHKKEAPAPVSGPTTSMPSVSTQNISPTVSAINSAASEGRTDGSSFWTDPKTGTIWAKVGPAHELPTHSDRTELPADAH